MQVSGDNKWKKRLWFPQFLVTFFFSLYHCVFAEGSRQLVTLYIWFLLVYFIYLRHTWCRCKKKYLILSLTVCFIGYSLFNEPITYCMLFCRLEKTLGYPVHIRVSIDLTYHLTRATNNYAKNWILLLKKLKALDRNNLIVIYYIILESLK